MRTPTEQKERPGVGTEAIQKLAGELTDTNSTKRLGIIRISDAAEAYINDLASELAIGAVELWQLPPSLFAFYSFAWADGNASAAAPELERLRWERDLWYFCANNRGKRPSDFYRQHTNELWAEATR